MRGLIADLRHAVRLILRSPVFSAVAVGTLALGIGANAAIFALVDRVMLRSLPVRSPRELVLLRSPGPAEGHTWNDGDDATSFSYPMYRDLAKTAPVFSGLVAEFPFSVSLSASGETERAAGELVSGNYFALVNESMVGKYFSGKDPVGSRLRVEWGTDSQWRTIVGVVASVRGERLDTAPSPEIYFPFAQHPVSNPVVLLATTLPPEKMLLPVRNAVWSIDRDLPLRSLVPLSQIVAGSYARRRFSTVLLAVFGSAALLIASLGVYGVLSQLVSERRKEIGIRLTLGAQRSDVFRLIAGRGLFLTATGIGIGVVMALAVTRTLGALLYEVSPTDPLTFAALTAIMAAVSLVATALPAHRATRVDPAIALRQD